MRWACALTLFALAGCDTIGMVSPRDQEFAARGAQLSLRDVVDFSAATRIADCVAGQAKDDEIDVLISAGKGGATGPSVALAQSILVRPDTQACIAKTNMGLDG